MSQTTTRDEKRSALDDFAALPQQALVPVTAPDFLPQAGQVHGAIAVAVHRDESRVLARLKALAAAAGADWYYRFPVKNRKTGTVEFIEGPSIKLANDVARLYGNAEIDCRAQDVGDSWLFHARFVDLETGYSLTRPFQQRKSGGRIGGADDERRLDIAFQIGASKAIRNVVVNALQTFSDFAFDEAREALVDKIGKDLGQWRKRTVERLAERKVELGRVEQVIGRVAAEWLAPDVAKVIAMMKAVADGMATLDETFPALRSTAESSTAEAKSSLDAFANAGISSDPPAASTAADEGGGEGLRQASAAADDSGSPASPKLAGEGGDDPGPPATHSSPPQDPDKVLRSEAIAEALQIAGRSDIEVDDRLERLDGLRMQLLDRLSAYPVFTKTLIETAARVARKELAKAAALKYLASLKDG
jgi:hypothetical protein